MKKTLDFGLADIFLQKLHMDEILIETEVKEVSNCVLDVSQIIESIVQ